MAIIKPSATTNVSIVLTEYITDGPIIIRTAFRSFVARDIKSPGPVGLEIRRRELLQMSEEVVPHVVLDAPGSPDDDPAHQEPEETADQPNQQQPRPVLQQFAARNTTRQIVDRVLKNLRRGERDRLCDDGASKSQEELPPVSAHVAEEAAKGTHLVVSIILRPMHALYIILPALIFLWLAYRYYSAYIAVKVWAARRLARNASPPEIRRR
jgi:hypothetical protein